MTYVPAKDLYLIEASMSDTGRMKVTGVFCHSWVKEGLLEEKEDGFYITFEGRAKAYELVFDSLGLDSKTLDWKVEEDERLNS